MLKSGYKLHVDEVALGMSIQALFEILERLSCGLVGPFKWMHFNNFCVHYSILGCDLQYDLICWGMQDRKLFFSGDLACWCVSLGLQVGQVHGGLMGVIQRATVKACPHVWFERSEIKDRHLVTKRWGVSWNGELCYSCDSGTFWCLTDHLWTIIPQLKIELKRPISGDVFVERPEHKQAVRLQWEMGNLYNLKILRGQKADLQKCHILACAIAFIPDGHC